MSDDKVVTITGTKFKSPEDDVKEPCEALIDVLENLLGKAKSGDLQELAFVTRYSELEISRGYAGRGLSGLMAGIIWQLALEYREDFDTVCLIEDGLLEE
jgi:hypothetical protein